MADRETNELGNLKYVRNQAILGEWTGGLDTPMELSNEPYPAYEHNNWPEWLPANYRNHYYGYLQQYTHNINFLRWLLDAGGNVKVKSVHMDAEDGLSGIVVFEIDGILVTLESGNIKHHEWHEQTQIFLTQGWLKSTMPSLLLRNVPAKVEEYKGNAAHPALTEYFPENGRSWMYKNELKKFFHCIQTGEPFSESIEDTMHDVRIIEEIYKQNISNW